MFNSLSTIQYWKYGEHLIPFDGSAFTYYERDFRLIYLGISLSSESLVDLLESLKKMGVGRGAT